MSMNTNAARPNATVRAAAHLNDPSLFFVMQDSNGWDSWQLRAGFTTETALVLNTWSGTVHRTDACREDWITARDCVPLPLSTLPDLLRAAHGVAAAERGIAFCGCLLRRVTV